MCDLVFAQTTVSEGQCPLACISAAYWLAPVWRRTGADLVVVGADCRVVWRLVVVLGGAVFAAGEDVPGQ